MTENPELNAQELAPAETEASSPVESESVDRPKATKKPATRKPATAKAKSASRAKAPKVADGDAPSHDASRGRRKVREGVVVSNRMAKTVVVMVQRRTQHPLYGKVVIRSNKFKAHDEQSCDVGDRVEIMETRPLSRDKRWRVTQILEKVK